LQQLKKVQRLEEEDNTQNTHTHTHTIIDMIFRHYHTIDPFVF